MFLYVGNDTRFIWHIEINLYLRSRSFSVNGEAYLIPLADMLNHQNDAKTSFSMQGDTFVMTVQDVYKIRSQVYNNYRPRSNSDLLRLYGFRLDNNQITAIPLDIQLDTHDPYLKQKNELLEKQNIKKYG